MNVTIEIRTGLSAGYSHTFDREAVIGRDPNCDLAVADDARISRRHARIRVQGKQVLLEDMGSTNGTKMGNKRIQGSVPLTNGGQFRVGHTTILVTWV